MSRRLGFVRKIYNFMKSKQSVIDQQTSPAEKSIAPPSLIQKRAHELYLLRGQEPGHELEDWLQAERELLPMREEARANKRE